jgi:hypothetical protein
MKLKINELLFAETAFNELLKVRLNAALAFDLGMKYKELQPYFESANTARIAAVQKYRKQKVDKEGCPIHNEYEDFSQEQLKKINDELEEEKEINVEQLDFNLIEKLEKLGEKISPMLIVGLYFVFKK